MNGNLALAAARIVPVFALAPFAGPDLRWRVAAALPFVVLLAPAVHATDVSAPALAREAFLGALLGWLAALPFRAAETAGRLVDPVLARFARVLATVVFFAFDGHLLLVRALAASYQATPAPPAMLSAALAAASHFVLAALGLAAPALAASFLADLTLAFVSRFSARGPVYFPAMPAKAVLAVLVSLLALTGTVTALRGEFGLVLRELAQAR